uniref:Uncharacterized protein n=1 Tax=Anguilla anguilla TaxID=7936 RepID=A0A0E9XFQ2_ANGAN
MSILSMAQVSWTALIGQTLGGSGNNFHTLSSEPPPHASQNLLSTLNRVGTFHCEQTELSVVPTTVHAHCELG